MDHLTTPENLRFHRHNWLAERIGWAVLAGVVLAAALGLFGRGAFSSIERMSADGALTVSYRRFLRAQSPTELRVTVAPQLATEGRFRLWLDAPYLRDFALTGIEPSAVTTELGSNRTLFHFATTATVPVTVTFHLEGQDAGFSSGAVGAGETRVEFTQFVYP